MHNSFSSEVHAEHITELVHEDERHLQPGCDHFEVWCGEHGGDVTADRDVTEHGAQQVNRGIVQHAE